MPDPALGLGWISWDIASLSIVDTAQGGLLNVAASVENSTSRVSNGLVVGPRGRMAIRGRSGFLVATVLPYVLNGYMSIEARMTSTGEGKNR